MAESIIRGSKERFTVIYDSVTKDENLSLKTLGLFTVMSSFPDSWEYSVAGLSKRCRVGRDTVRKCLRELEDAGYLIREQTHDDQGRFSGAVFVLQSHKPHEKSPLTEKPSTVKPTSVLPMTENRPQEYIQENNIPPKAPQGGHASRKRSDPKKTADWKPERFDAFWEFYRSNVRPEAKQAAIRAWDKLQPDDDLIARIGRALQRQIASQSWQDGYGKPYASTYLNNARWEDAEGLTPAGPPPLSPDDGRHGRFL